MNIKIKAQTPQNFTRVQDYGNEVVICACNLCRFGTSVLVDLLGFHPIVLIYFFIQFSSTGLV